MMCRYLQPVGRRARYFAGGANTLQVGRVVQRCQRNAILDAGDYIVVYPDAALETLGAMDAAVTDCVDIIQALDAGNVRGWVCYPFDGIIEGCLVVPQWFGRV